MKCGAGEGWRRPFGRIMWETKNFWRVKEAKNSLQTIKRRKANWIGHILRRNCLLKHLVEGQVEGRIEVRRNRWRIRKLLLHDLKEKGGYWKLKGEAYRTLWRTGFGIGYGNVKTDNRMFASINYLVFILLFSVRYELIICMMCIIWRLRRAELYIDVNLPLW